ncbi:sugar phosphate isomerase/epimerase family protein [Halorubrum vacuolatum]|uniref:Sugar phosphate isomerase/epimerase n=1 Tax=Halorubrum vacuolatum TaxID=63740 RepID=A0A238VT76_HALVU|nr:sugar phosphate isomerase/epimerase [Halorubrum vacuolatum]SNR37532.1 Sugar phosphate isomerase/epimerase [Halorubrum vacuolatum]
MRIGCTVGVDLDLVSASSDAFDFVEIGVGDGSLPPETIDPDRLATDLAGRDLLVHLPYSGTLTSYAPELNDGFVASQRRLLETVGDLGAEKAVLHATTADRDDVEFREIAAEQLRRVADAGWDAGVEVVVENVGHHHDGVQLSILGDLVRETDLPVCFDIGHAYMEGGNDAIKRFLRSHADRISHLHLHDVRRRGDTHLPIGAGEIEYDPVRETLADFDGTVALEVFTDDTRLLADSAERAAEMLGTTFPTPEGNGTHTVIDDG